MIDIFSVSCLDSQKLLAVSSSTLDGFNFSYQGLSGIWESFRPNRPQVSTQPTPRLPQRGLLLDFSPTPVSNLIAEAGGGHPSRSHSRQGKRSRPASDVAIDEFTGAVNTLLGETLPTRSFWKPAVSTNKLAQRQLMLHLCDWSLGEEDIAKMVRRWEKEHRYTQAACWLVFTKQHRAAVEVLMRSKGVSHSFPCPHSRPRC